MKLFCYFLSITLLCLPAAFGDIITPVSDNTLLTDTALWSGLGTPQTGSSLLSYSATCDSVLACSVTSTDSVGVSAITSGQPTGWALYLLSPATGFGAGFGFSGTGDLLYNGGSLGTQTQGNMTLDFSTPVSGAGFYVNATDPYFSYTFTLSAFSNSGLIGSPVTVAYNGYSGTSPVFIGFTDSVQDVSYVTIGLSSTNAGVDDFAIDTLYLQDGPGGGGSSTPEPASLLLTGLGLVSLGAIRVVRRR